MMCKRCNHEDYSHAGGVGQCQVWIVKKEYAWKRTDEFGPGLEAWSSGIDYEKQCPCSAFTDKRPNKHLYRHGVTLDDYLTHRRKDKA